MSFNINEPDLKSEKLEIKKTEVKHYDILVTSANHFTRASFIGFTAEQVTRRTDDSFNIAFSAIGSFMIVGGCTDAIVNNLPSGKEISLILAGATFLYRVKQGDFYKASGQLVGFVAAYYMDDNFNKKFYPSSLISDSKKESEETSGFMDSYEKFLSIGFKVAATDLLVGLASSEDTIKLVTPIRNDFTLGGANKFVDTFLFLEVFKHITLPNNLISLLIGGSFPVLLESRSKIHDYIVGNNNEHLLHSQKLLGAAYGLFFWLPVRKLIEFSIKEIISLQDSFSSSLKEISDCLLAKNDCQFLKSNFVYSTFFNLETENQIDEL
jgi:hypothetical protein